MASPIATSTCLATTTFATSSDATDRTAWATMASNEASDRRGLITGPGPAGRRPSAPDRFGGTAPRTDRPGAPGGPAPACSQARVPAGSSGSCPRVAATTVTHSSPEDSTP